MVALPSASTITTTALPILALNSTLNVNATPFYPTVKEARDDEHPHSPGTNGFVAADSFFLLHEISDEELFDSKLHPLTPEELFELEQVDEINAMLADLDIMETHQELYQEHTKTHQVSTHSDLDAELRNLAKKPTKRADYVKHTTRLPKKNANYHVKKNFFAPIQQPRSVK